ncbi:MAG: hypothetical protein ACYC0H_13125 [Solirubrobacteraceae bacterium]
MRDGRFLWRQAVRLRRRTRLIPVVIAALAVAGFPASALAAHGGGGGGETTATNNLSVPTIWSDGVGLTVPGTYGTTLYDGATFTTADGTTVWANGDPLNQWQAENVFGVTGTPVNVSQLDWGDSLESKSFSLGKPIRVETSLIEDNLPATMTGYTMLSNGLTKDQEKFGNDKTTYTTNSAYVYSACARLTIQRLEISRTDPAVSRMVWDPAGHQWTGAGLVASPIVNQPDAAELNGSGKAIYGYNWTSTDVAGDYRVTFSLNGSCEAAPLNTFLTSASAIFVSTETAAVARPAAEPVGSTPKIDSANNLSYIDVELGTPTYTPYIAPPTNTELPVISGSPFEGETLSSSAGTWADNPTSFSYQWQSCDGSGANCTNVAGANGVSYTLTSSQVGRTMRILVTASNAGGSTTAASAVTAAVATAASKPAQPTATPGLMEMPVIHGSAMERQVLTATTGKWSNNPSVYSYQWKRCDRYGNKCVNIAGATKRTYKLSAADIGHRVRVEVTASNAGGSTAGTSAASKIVKGYVSPTKRTRAQLTIQMRHIAGNRLRISGTVRPRHDRKMLLIQRRTPNGWQTVAKARLRMQNRVRSQYTTTLRNPKRGAYRVYLAGDKAHVPSTSRQVTVR